MKKIVFASTDKGAGKTSLIVGLSKTLGGSMGYMKPLGDRLLYRKKRLWDQDSALITNIFGLSENPEDMSIGFEHAKLRYMYTEEETKNKLHEVERHVSKGKEILFIEAGQDLACGSSIYLDALTVTRDLGGKLVIVVSGGDDKIIDEISFIKKYISVSNIDFGGVIINKVKDVDDFKNTSMEILSKLGVPVLGVVPYKEELAYFSMGFLADSLFAKVVAGANGLNKVAKRIFVGAMSASRALEIPLFRQPDKLLIASGDRIDILIAGMETGVSGIILTGNILPPTNIISKATELNVPLLLASQDTYQIAKKIDDLEPLLTKESEANIKLLSELVKTCVDLKI